MANIPVGFPSAKPFTVYRHIPPHSIGRGNPFLNHFSALSSESATIATDDELPIRAAPAEIIALA